MKTRAIILTLSVATMGIGLPVAACDFHGAGFGAAYGTQWQPYNAEGRLGDDLDFSPIEKTEAPKAKPVFSKVASRASDIAKERVKAKAEKKDDAKSETKLAEVKAD